MIHANAAKKLSEKINMDRIEQYIVEAAGGGLTNCHIPESEFTVPRLNELKKNGYEVDMTANGYTISWKNAKQPERPTVNTNK